MQALKISNAFVVPLSQTFIPLRRKSYKLVVVGGGSGGCSTAAKFSSKLGEGNVAIIEPKNMHYYQPMWTLVGGGMKTLSDSGKPMADVLPKSAEWIKDKVAAFHPHENRVITSKGKEINYEFLVIAVGLQNNYGAVKGLPEAFETPGVCSNFSDIYVEKTYEALKNFKEGNAIFTLPNTPIKCPGAPQKIMYIAEEYLRKNNKKDKANIMFNSSLGVLFGVKKYANALWKVVEERGLTVNLRHNLIEVKSNSKEAVFQLLDKPEEKVTFSYEMLHVTPPMAPPDALKSCKDLTDQTGFLNVHRDNLQHVKYPNIFGIGDCTNLPTSRTAAAVAAQLGVLRKNLSRVIKGKDAVATYNGYTSCPLVTGYSKCILAEFDYNAEPMETFPVDQGKERRSMFHMKKDLMPTMYWNAMLNGYWEGPQYMRKALHFGMCK